MKIALIGLVLSSVVMGSEASTICRSWFEQWGKATIKSMAHEYALAKRLGLDNRSKKAIEGSVSVVLAASQYLCQRLSSVTELKAETARATPALNCLQTFSDWENLMDSRFTDLIFQQDLLSKINEYAPAQQLHRREAAQAAKLCKMLDFF